MTLPMNSAAPRTEARQTTGRQLGPICAHSQGPVPADNRFAAGKEDCTCHLWHCGQGPVCSLSTWLPAELGTWARMEVQGPIWGLE